jgi:hypothetical protein
MCSGDKLKGASFEFDIDRFELKYRSIRGFEMRLDYFGGRYIDGVEYRLDWGVCLRGGSL